MAAVSDSFPVSPQHKMIPATVDGSFEGASFSSAPQTSSGSTSSGTSDGSSPRSGSKGAEDCTEQDGIVPDSADLDNRRTSADGQDRVADALRLPVATKRTPDDFIFEKVIGEGSFSTVYLARDIHTSKQWAIKVCERMHIKREKKEKSIMREKDIMQLLGLHPSPFFVELFCSFSDQYRLYFVMTYAKNGEILPYIHKVGCFDAECTKFYGGEVILALEHLHKLGIIHRDLKPENILLNEHMHILITDFGSAKLGDQPDVVEAVTSSGDEDLPGMRPRKNSFVGTADYVSPELLTNKDANRTVDLWALGCFLYQLLAGLPPFRAPNEYLIFQKIIKLDFSFPDGFNPIAKDLVAKLLVKDSKERLGSDAMGGYPVLKSHPFFEGLEWEILHTVKPPAITPYLPASGDNEELRSDIVISPNIKPGFDEKQLSRLLDLQLREGSGPKPSNSKSNVTGAPKGTILDISPEDYAERLAAQAKSNQWHQFVDNHLILKQGFIDKRKGLFARRRMFLLTTGPHLYYVDPVSMISKGEIPWSANMRPEPKNFKTFFVHTPNRTYYLEDPHGYALEWCRVLEEVRALTYDKRAGTSEPSKEPTKKPSI